MLVGGIGVPMKHSFSRDGWYDALVMEVLGPNLHQLFDVCGRRFTLKTVLVLADQILTRIEYVHQLSVIHGDVKPGNFVMGLGKRGNQVYIIDFNLATTFRDPKSHVLYPSHEGHGFRGTGVFASVNAHKGLSVFVILGTIP